MRGRGFSKGAWRGWAGRNHLGAGGGRNSPFLLFFSSFSPNFSLFSPNFFPFFPFFPVFPVFSRFSRFFPHFIPIFPGFPPVHIQENLEDALVQEALQTGVDLRQYSRQVELELQEVERASIQDCIPKCPQSVPKVSPKCPQGVPKRMEEMLGSFQSSLSSLSWEIRALQGQAGAMNLRLRNRRQVHQRLGHLLDELVVVILESPVTSPEFLEQLRALSGKIEAVKEQSFRDTLACDDVQHVLDRLRIKVTGNYQNSGAEIRPKIPEFAPQKIPKFWHRNPPKNPRICTPKNPRILTQKNPQILHQKSQNSDTKNPQILAPKPAPKIPKFTPQKSQILTPKSAQKSQNSDTNNPQILAPKLAQKSQNLHPKNPKILTQKIPKILAPKSAKIGPKISKFWHQKRPKNPQILTPKSTKNPQILAPKIQEMMEMGIGGYWDGTGTNWDKLGVEKWGKIGKKRGKFEFFGGEIDGKWGLGGLGWNWDKLGWNWDKLGQTGTNWDLPNGGKSGIFSRFSALRP
uniref:Vacuolar protein sorting-associated protein 52 homolog n=1 Tax=Cyanoderma ruficeps TaxID=181631 RepID=A0A8C3P344_9PASS